MAAELAVCAVRAHDHRERVPAQRGGQPFLEFEVARIGRLFGDRDGVHVARDGRAHGREPVGPRVLGEPVEQVLRAVPADVRDDRVERVEPLASFLGVGVGMQAAGALRCVDTAR